MKALVYKGPCEVEVQEKQIPRIAGNALVKVSYSGVCGTDLSIFAGKHPRAKGPLILGHEFSGTIIEVEENPQGIQPGDRVSGFPLISCGECLACRTGNRHVCNTLRLTGIDYDGCMAEYASMPANMLMRIPDDLEDEVGALLEPLSVIIHGIHQSGFQLMDKVMITGGGPIGMIAGIVLQEIGAGIVYISEVNPYRLSVCKDLGLHAINLQADDPISYIKDRTNGEGVDLLIEASGSPQAAAQMTELVRSKGTICMLSVHKEPALVDVRQINFKEITMVGSRCQSREAFMQAVQYAPRIKESLRKIITHKIPLAESHTVFDILRDPDQKALKVLIDSK